MTERALDYCLYAIATLENSTDFAVDYVHLKTEFFLLYQGGAVFSTRFGADFFFETFQHLIQKTFLKPLAQGEELSDLDKAYNRWLKENAV